MAEPANVLKGSARISLGGGNPVYVAGANSGYFDENTAIVDNGAGDSTLTIDAEAQLGPRDVVEGEIEGTAGGTMAIERLTTTTIRVRTFNAAGVAADLDFGLTISTHNIG